MLRVFVQRSTDRLFLKARGLWVALKEEAKAFASCGDAINYCVAEKLTDVRLWVSFDDGKYDFPMEVFRTEKRMLVQFDAKTREKRRALLSELGKIVARGPHRKTHSRLSGTAMSDGA